MGITKTRVPFEPIDREFYRGRSRQVSKGKGSVYPGTSDIVLGELLGMDRGAIVRYRREGLPVELADEVAVMIGFHPCELWPEWAELASA